MKNYFFIASILCVSLSSCDKADNNLDLLRPSSEKKSFLDDHKIHGPSSILYEITGNYTGEFAVIITAKSALGVEKETIKVDRLPWTKIVDYSKNIEKVNIAAANLKDKSGLKMQYASLKLYNKVNFLVVSRDATANERGEINLDSLTHVFP